VLALAPLRQGARHWHDIRWIYVAGMCWADGVSPYPIENFASHWMELPENFAGDGVEPTQPYVYPPYLGAIAVPMAQVSWPIARRIWDLANVIALFAALFFAAQLARRDLSSPQTWALAGLAMLIGAIPYTMATSQLSLVSTAAIAGMFWAKERGRKYWIPPLILIAGVKPQLALLPVVYLAASGALLEVLFAAVIACVLSLAVLIPSSLPTFSSDYSTAYALHMEAPFNARTNFTSLPAALGNTSTADLFMAILPLFAIGATLWLARRKRSQDILLLLALAPACMPLHIYDLVIYAPAILLLPQLGRKDMAILAAVAMHLAARAVKIGELAGLVPVAPYLTTAAAICVGAGWMRRSINLGTR
jgi:hypothetical protein